LGGRMATATKRLSRVPAQIRGERYLTIGNLKKMQKFFGFRVPKPPLYF